MLDPHTIKQIQEKDDPYDALEILFGNIDQINLSLEEGVSSRIDFHEDLLALAAVAHVIITDFGLSLEIISVLEDDPNANVHKILKYFDNLKERMLGITAGITYNRYLHMYEAEIGKGFYYKFSNDDLTKIQKLLTELRELISEGDLFTENHRSRLLLRLERLQAELHKKISDLDHFWGLIGDAGVALGKLGSDAKPIVDRIREIAGIVWRAQAKAEELPSESKFPLLTDDTK